MKDISVEKYHSYGNDFLIIPAGQVSEADCSRLAQAICHRHTGLGADGCLFLRSDPPQSFSLRIFNQDGSEAGMSGNGSRCVCAFLHRNKVVSENRIRLDTPSGEKIHVLLGEEDGMWKYRAGMGSPLFMPETIPFQDTENLESVENYPLEAAGTQLVVSALSVGNPQCVVFVEEFPSQEDFRRLGGGLERHPRFPDRTNVSFVKVEAPNEIRILIWERGVGPTCSSGTGSCGAAVAALRLGKVSSPVQVHTEHGRQEVEWSPGHEIQLTGISEFVGRTEYFWK